MVSVPVPNHLDVEDTFVFGLTMRQCLLLFIGAVMSYVLFLNGLSVISDPRLALFGSAAMALLLFVGMLLIALLRLGGRGLEEWGLVSLIYLSRPKIALWRFAPPDACARRPMQARDRATRERQNWEDEAW